MSSRSSLLTLGICALWPFGTLLAQTPPPTQSATASPTPDALLGKSGRPSVMLQNLSPEDVQKLRQARQAALADPAVQATRAGGDQRAFRKAMRETILRNDPSLAPVLAKMRPNAAVPPPAGQPGQAVAKRPLTGELEKRLAFLPEDEQVKVRNAAVGAQSDPKLSALRQKMQSAPTPEEKKPAAKAYREELRNAMLRYDPSLAPVLEKLRAHRQADEGAEGPAL